MGSDDVSDKFLTQTDGMNGSIDWLYMHKKKVCWPTG